MSNDQQYGFAPSVLPPSEYCHQCGQDNCTHHRFGREYERASIVKRLRHVAMAFGDPHAAEIADAIESGNL